MSTSSYTRHKGRDGKVYETRTTKYDNGSSKSVTRREGGMFGPGKLVNVTRRKERFR